MKIDELKVIDILEKLREYFLQKEPSLEKQFQFFQANFFNTSEIIKYKEILTAIEFNIDLGTSSGKRKARNIIRLLDETINKNGDSNSPLFIAESLESDVLSKNISERFFTSIQNLKDLYCSNDDKNSGDGVFNALSKYNDYEDLIKFIRKSFPSLQGNKTYRFLNQIGYSIGIPDVKKYTFLKRLGFSNFDSAKDQSYREYHTLSYHFATLLNESLPYVDYIFGLFCGSERFHEKDLAICVKKPYCNECSLKSLCQYYSITGNEKNSFRHTMRDLEKNLQPREKLIENGGESLSDTELLALIIKTGHENATALDLAMQLLKKFRDIKGIYSASLTELCSIKGIGYAKAAEIKASFELGMRLLSSPSNLTVKFTNSKEIFTYFYPRTLDMEEENFYSLLLNTKNYLLREILISKGSLSSSIVHPREAFKEAIKESAASVIFIHNHPSGDPAPSKEDEIVTIRLKEVGDLVGIKLLDHIIIGGKKYYSFSDETGLL